MTKLLNRKKHIFYAVGITLLFGIINIFIFVNSQISFTVKQFLFIANILFVNVLVFLVFLKSKKEKDLSLVQEPSELHRNKNFVQSFGLVLIGIGIILTYGLLVQILKTSTNITAPFYIQLSAIKVSIILISGIGIFYLQNWARNLLIAFGSLILFCFFISVIFLLRKSLEVGIATILSSFYSIDGVMFWICSISILLSKRSSQVFLVKTKDILSYFRLSNLRTIIFVFLLVFSFIVIKSFDFRETRQSANNTFSSKSDLKFKDIDDSKPLTMEDLDKILESKAPQK